MTCTACSKGITYVALIYNGALTVFLLFSATLIGLKTRTQY